MSVTTTTGKPIGDYEDYHTEDGQTIADVSYFEQDAIIPLAGKYSSSDAKKTTKSVKLSDVIGGGVTVATDGGIERLSNGSIQLDGIDSASTGTVPTKSNDGISWTTPVTLPSMTGKEGYALSVENDSGTLKPYWEKNVNVVYTDDGIVYDSGSGGVHIAVNLIEDGGLEFGDKPSSANKGIKVSNPVPPPGTNQNRGKLLTVNSSDQVVWEPVHIPVIGTINITPAPSYNYIILQNFLDGHTIGTPIPGDSDYSDFYNTYPADMSTVWTTVEDWSDTNLVSTTAGDQLLYSDNSFDFSKYGLTAGQVPFGFCHGYKYNGAGYANITLPSEWTLETWFYSPLGDGDYTDPFWGSFFEIGPSYPNLIRLFLETNSISLHAMGDELFDVSKTVTNQAWHHVALSCDGTNMYTFYDGELIGTVAISSVSGLSTMLASAVKVMVNVDSNGNGSNELWYAQLALCDSCKWTDDFNPSKEAY